MAPSSPRQFHFPLIAKRWAGDKVGLVALVALVAQTSQKLAGISRFENIYLKTDSRLG